MISHFIANLKKEIVWSFFISIYLFFPLLNSLELIVYGKQGGSIGFVLFCWCFFSFLFILKPFFYDLSINVMFSNPLGSSMTYLEKFSLFLKDDLRVVGVFYGLCFLSFYLKVEFPSSLFFYLVNAFLLIARNFFVIPYLGLNLVFLWIMVIFNILIEKKILNQTIFASLKEKNSGCQKSKKFEFFQFLASVVLNILIKTFFLLFLLSIENKTTIV